MTTEKTNITNVIQGIFDVVERENKEIYRSVATLKPMQDAVDAINSNDPEAFYFALTCPVEDVIDGLLATEIPKSTSGQFLYRESEFVDRHFQSLFVLFEGSPCSADKSRAVVQCLARFFRYEKAIKFDYAQQYTYHLPKTIFTTHDEIIAFFEALKSLYYGRPEKYLKLMTEDYCLVR